MPPLIVSYLQIVQTGFHFPEEDYKIGIPL